MLGKTTKHNEPSAVLCEAFLKIKEAYIFQTCLRATSAHIADHEENL